MKWNACFLKSTVFFLILALSVTPGMVGVLGAQTTPAIASNAEVQTIQELAKAGYLGDKKDYYLSSTSLDEDDITDAILQARSYVMAGSLKNLSWVNTFKVSDLQSLLSLAQEKSGDIRERKISAWRLENHLRKMIALLSTPPTSETTPGAISSPTVMAAVATATAIPPTPTATPIPGPSRQEFNDLKESFNNLNTQLLSLQGNFQKNEQAHEQTLESLQNDDTDLKISSAGNQGQLKLIKKILDQVQNDFSKSQDHMNEVEKEVNQKVMTDTQMQQEVDVMNKDLQDNTEDISVLKEQVAELNVTNAPPKGPFDDFFDAKWLPGAALFVGLVALSVSLVRK